MLTHQLVRVVGALCERRVLGVGVYNWWVKRT